MPRPSAKEISPNLLFPGRPSYVGPTEGTFGLLHHDQLYEPSQNVMKRVAYVRENKPTREVAIRLHNMIYLNADYEAKRAPLYADYEAKRAPLYADYEAKLASLDAKILAYIRKHIPDCAWDAKRKKLQFPG